MDYEKAYNMKSVYWGRVDAYGMSSAMVDRIIETNWG